METFLIYFLKANLVLSILFPVFWLILKDEKFFLLNRILLLGIILFSLLLPVAPSIEDFGSGSNAFNPADYAEVIGFSNQISAPINVLMATQNDQNLQVDATNAFPATRVSLKSIVFFLYIIISSIFLLRFLAQLFRLFNILRDSERREQGDFTFYISKADLTPFSFFNYLVINDTKYDQCQMNQIVEHEKVHIKQWHTIDILLAEVFHIVFWINPLVRSLKQYLKLNLEYLADQEVLYTGVDTKSYQLNILQSCLNPAAVPLTNLFFSSKIKLRIKMMNTKKTPKYRLYKYAFVLPLVVLMYFAVNTANAKNEPYVSLITYGDFKAYEGYYKFQFKPGKDSYIRIMTKNNQLVLNELWSGKEIVFDQKSELEFFNKSEKFPLKFTKSKEGAITQVLAFGKDLWNKDNEYKPKSKTAIAMTPDQLKTFEGYYQLPKNKEMVVKVVARQNDLIVQNQWDGTETPYSPESDRVFFVKSGDNDVTINFEKDNKGIVTSGTDFTGRT